jgi:hypothetical protein
VKQEQDKVKQEQARVKNAIQAFKSMGLPNDQIANIVGLTLAELEAIYLF